MNKNFKKALAYINSIPLERINQVNRRVFEGDGAEVVVGLIKDYYIKQNYSQAVKIWEIYKDKYEDKVAKSPYLAFIVADSFLKLGLQSSFTRAYTALKKSGGFEKRTFPAWIEAHKTLPVESYIEELDLLQNVYNKDWAKVSVILDKMNEDKKKELNYDYYKGLVNFHNKDYKASIKNFEKIITGPNKNNQLSLIQNINMLTSYVESLYQAGDSETFRKNALAVANDIEETGNEKLMKVNEKIYYLLAEDLFAGVKASKTLEKICKKFLMNFPNSEYQDRVNYLYGHSLARNDKFRDARNVLNELVGKEETPEYIKELARSELSSLKIKEKSL